MNAQASHTYLRKPLMSILLATLFLLSPLALLADADDPPQRVARLGELQGTVSIEPAGVDNWSAAAANYPIATGDRVYADTDGRAEVQIGQTVARIWHNTDLSVTNLSDNMIQLGLAQGTLRLRTYGLDPQTEVEIDTPNGALTITRPGDVRVDSYPGDGGTVVTVDSGEVQLTGPGLSEQLQQGQSLRLVGTNPIELANLEMPGLDEFDSWSLDRDRHAMNSVSARYVSRDASGYDDLDDYGDWTPQSDYGPVWYPRNVPADWVPYRYGHWVWTGPWGWTWVDDQPWGYAPFHYGRWAYVGNRWGWVPGPVAVRPVWSPALVAFVGGPHFSVGIGVSAWFPLGPGEAYRPWYHCSPAYVNRVNITNIRVTRVVNVRHDYNVVNETNVTYVHRTAAVTAVNGQSFGSARPVQANLIHLDQHQIQQAQVIPHPDIRPTRQSVVAQPVSNLRVPTARPTLLTQGGKEAAAVPGAKVQPVPYKPLSPNAMQHAETAHPLNTPPPASTAHSGATPPVNQPRETYNGANQPHGNPPQNTLQHSPQQPASSHPQQPVMAPPAQNPPTMNNHPQQPVAAPPAGQNPQRQPYNPPPAYSHPQQPVTTSQEQYQQRQPTAQPLPPVTNQQQGQKPLVYRNETPAPRPTFEQQQPAMNQHPGRPLEPQQIQNIQQGRPAGPQKDQELIPHAPPQQHNQPMPQQAPPPQHNQQPAPQHNQQQSPPPAKEQPHNQQQKNNKDDQKHN